MAEPINTINPETGDITTSSVRTIEDLGYTYAELFADSSAELINEFRIAHDEYGEIDRVASRAGEGEIDYEALGAHIADAVGLGEFIEDGNEYTSGGHTVYSGFTWFRKSFDDQVWAAITKAYPVQEKTISKELPKQERNRKLGLALGKHAHRLRRGPQNTIDPETGNITTSEIRTTTDYAHAMVDLFWGANRSNEFLNAFRQGYDGHGELDYKTISELDEKDIGKIDYEALGKSLFSDSRISPRGNLSRTMTGTATP